MPVFTPPTVADVPAVYPQDRENQHPWSYFSPGVRGINVFKLKAGGYTQEQPADQTTIAYWYWGAHSHTVDAAEAALLTAAGYGAFIV